MLSVFSEGQKVMSIGSSTLPDEINQLKQQILKLVGDHRYQYVQVYDQLGLPALGPHVEPILLSYAVVAADETSATHVQPLKITIRKTDRTGNILFKSPSTTVA